MRLARIWRPWLVVCLAVAASQAAAEDASPPAAEYAPTAEGVIVSLNDVLAWYRQAKVVTQVVSHPSGAPLTRDGEQLALQVVERAFEAARASLPLIPREGAREAGPRERRTNQREDLTATVRRREEDVGRLRARVRTAPARGKPALERELATARNLLELDRARLDFATKLSESAATLTEGDTDLARQIQALQDAVPGMKVTAVQPGPAPVVEAETAGTWGLVRRLLAVRRSRSSLGALKSATADLKQSVERQTGAIRGELRPIMSRLRALAENPTLSGATLAEGEQEFKDSLQRRKALVAVMLPLRGQLTLLRQFADDLQGWDQVLDRQSRQLLQGIGLDFLRVGIALLIILIGALFWRVTVRRYVSDSYRQRLLMSTRNGVVLVAIALVLIFHFTSELATLVTVLGFAAAGIAFALQAVILALAGYFSMVAPNGIRVGEYVALQGPFGYVHGEVVDIGFLRMRLRELAGDSLRPTGRVVVFPNSVVFTGGFFKHPAPPSTTDPAPTRDDRIPGVGPERGGQATMARLGGR